MAYKIIYHTGETIDIKTKVRTGTAEIVENSLVIRQDSRQVMVINEIHCVEMFRLHGSMRMIKVIHGAGTLFLTVIRFNLWGYFVMVNFLAAGNLYKEVAALLASEKEGGN